MKKLRGIGMVFVLAAFALIFITVKTTAGVAPGKVSKAEIDTSSEIFPCVAFSPYVDGLNPHTGPHPSPELIDDLLDVVSQAGFRCIMTYGVLNGLDYIFQAAYVRGIKVIAIIWLDTDVTVNNESIEHGIQMAKTYSETIVRLSCGSEFRTRNGTGLDYVLNDCLSRVRAAGVVQPLTTIDTWWEWCNRSWPCQQWDMASSVDWIGVNIFPWWENKYSGLFPCTTAVEAADFHLARYQTITTRYPGKEVFITEFGWPAGPDGYTEKNLYTGQECGIASEANQLLVIKGTVDKLGKLRIQGIIFEAFREGDWKAAEGPVGRFWGFCEGEPPYQCKYHLFPYKVYLPAVFK